MKKLMTIFTIMLCIYLHSCTKNEQPTPPGSNPPGTVTPPPPVTDSCVICYYDIDTLYTVYNGYDLEIKTRMPVQVVADLMTATEYFLHSGADTTLHPANRALMKPAMDICERELYKKDAGFKQHFDVWKLARPGTLAVGARISGIQPCWWYLQ